MQGQPDATQLLPTSALDGQEDNKDPSIKRYEVENSTGATLATK